MSGDSIDSAALRFRLLDPLRGVAALWVFAFHYTFSERLHSAAPWLAQVFASGHLGVQMFFVISGYCMIASVRAATRDGESARSFLHRRFLRIYPPYWWSLVVVVALPFVIEGLSALKTGTFVMPSANGNVSLGFLDYGAGQWLRVATLTQVFAPLSAAAPHSLQFKFTTINAVYWTLAIEFQFYLVMAAALALKSSGMQWLAGVTIVSLPIAYWGGWDTVGVFLPYWPMFAVGILLYLVIEDGISLGRLAGRYRRGASATALLSLVVIFLSAVITGRDVGGLGFAVGFAAALWCLHGIDDYYARGLASDHILTRASFVVLKHVGLMSYSLYLLHGRLQFLAQQICRQVLRVDLMFDVVAFALTCAGAYLFYRWCERPFIRSRSQEGSPAWRGLVTVSS